MIDYAAIYHLCITAIDAYWRKMFSKTGGEPYTLVIINLSKPIISPMPQIIWIIGIIWIMLFKWMLKKTMGIIFVCFYISCNNVRNCQFRFVYTFLTLFVLVLVVIGSFVCWFSIIFTILAHFPSQLHIIGEDLHGLLDVFK